jgi:TonB family protein
MLFGKLFPALGQSKGRKRILMMSGWRASFQVVFLALAVLVPFDLQAQIATTSTDTAISGLASRIGEELKNLHVRSVIVADLTGPQGQAHPVGKWLADQLSHDLAASFPALEVLDRPRPQPFSSEDASSAVPGMTNLAKAQSAARDWARRLGANVVITGIFADVGQGIGISLKALNSSDAGLLLAEEWGAVPTSDIISDLSADPLPSISPRVPTAGRNGFGIPECIYCPAPVYTDQARRQKLIGAVVLQVTVTADGKPTSIYIWKSLGGGLDAQAVKVVSTWKMKPATGPDGKPAAVTTPIELTFGLY